MFKYRRGILALILALCILPLSGCGGDASADPEQSGQEPVTFTLGDVSFSAEHDETDVNPHRGYSGWACIRYGVGETLFRYSDTMEIQPWLATGYTLIDPLTWEITLRQDVRFTSGRALDAQAVKECLEHLVEVHDRARGDLMIDTMEAEGQTLTIRTTQPRPALLNYLSDPYGCIIDMAWGISEEGIVSGTGPYQAVSLVTGQELHLVKNKDYWGGEPQVDEITVLTISDGNTLTMALQSGQIDAAYGMPYASYPLFENEGYTFSSTPTSRAFFLCMNFESPLTQDPAVRQAIATAIDKEGFVNTLLEGNGYVASGAFPEEFSFGGGVTPQAYDPQGAREVLEAAGWVDSDGDGIREKDGKNLVIRWLTYPSRQELPLLAESAQAALGEIGIDVEINSTADCSSYLSDPGSWDVYASAMITAPTGDPEYFFASCCLDSSVANHGGYHSDRLEQLAQEMAAAFESGERSRLAVEMQQILLEDNAYVFCSHLRMSMISRAGVTGLTAHPCDFYELTADLRVEEP